MDAYERRYRIAFARVRVAAELARAAAWDRESAHEADEIQRKGFHAYAEEALAQVRVTERELVSLAALCNGCGDVVTDVTGVCARCATAELQAQHDARAEGEGAF
jgi:hypothetical protein